MREIKDTIVHSQSVCNSVEIMIRGQTDDVSIDASLKERREIKDTILHSHTVYNIIMVA